MGKLVEKEVGKSDAGEESLMQMEKGVTIVRRKDTLQVSAHVKGQGKEVGPKGKAKDMELLWPSLYRIRKAESGRKGL
eukprot:9058261-Karenia_brevis.AAC.1